MPSHRKRIGFLPSEEVHIIIEKISTDNNYSQSKVTGILVEEALRCRGFLNISFTNNSTLINRSLNNSTKENKSSFFNELLNNYESSNINSKSLKDNIKMMHEFIEFKLFKKIMNQKDNKNNQ